MYRDPDSYDDWYGRDEGDLHERLMDEERHYYGSMAEILSHGSREEVRAAIRGIEEDGRSAYDIQDAMLGADYPVDAGGFTGTHEQYQMVLDEMRRYGDETGDENWENAAYLTKTELENRGWDSLGPIEPSYGIHDAFGGTGEAWRKARSVAKGIGATFGGLARTAKQSAEAPKAGDIDVSAYDYTRNGKRVHVGAHKRKR